MTLKTLSRITCGVMAFALLVFINLYFDLREETKYYYSDEQYTRGTKVYYDDGYKTGLEHGFNDGYSKGQKTGHEEGLSEGYENGKDDTRKPAYDDGYTEGFRDGIGDEHKRAYAEGYNEGLDSGYYKGLDEAQDYYNEGVTDAYASNFSEHGSAYNVGFEAGHLSGLESGFESGYEGGFYIGYIIAKNSSNSSTYDPTTRASVYPNTSKTLASLVRVSMDSKNFHSDSCSKMETYAYTVTMLDAILAGHKPCPSCLDDWHYRAYTEYIENKDATQGSNVAAVTKP